MVFIFITVQKLFIKILISRKNNQLNNFQLNRGVLIWKMEVLSPHDTRWVVKKSLDILKYGLLVYSKILKTEIWINVLLKLKTGGEHA